MMSLFNTSEKEEGLSDEEILNVIRGADQKVLKTGEIADSLPISQAWTGTRLNELESEGRVHSKSAGRGRVWWLDEAESPFLVAEGIGDIMLYSSLANRTSKTVGVTGLSMFMISGALLIPIFLFNVFPFLKRGPLSVQDLVTVAMLAAIVAGLLLVAGGGLKLFSLGINRHFSIED